MSPRISATALLLAAVGVPLSLLWDYSWESTIGVDLFWSPPHMATFLAVLLAALSALALAIRERATKPVGAWLALWGAVAFVTAVSFDLWWQASYGLAAGIWHPPQLLKAAAFFAITIGAWLCAPRSGAAAVLALIGVVTLPLTFANQQHSAPFFLAACATYPLILAAASASGGRFAATRAALGYTLLVGAMVWLLPLFPASPLTGPIYHPRDHLLPPPFPLLLIAPALAVDLLRARPARGGDWIAAIEAGLAFFVVFTAVQWTFASFLLSPAADNRFFAGGGRQWPFFMQIHPSALTTFWKVPGEEFTLPRAVTAAALALLATRLGLALGRRMQPLHR
ncbi:MAG: hypothetical protein ABMA13_20385 [Chthoniobacteraceae bacterium]